MANFHVGQLWTSEMEPELGLGIITRVDKRQISIHFQASDSNRLYAIESAPLKRVRFGVGDQIQNQEGVHFTIKDMQEQEGLLLYIGDNLVLPENKISHKTSFTKPENRLLSRQNDSNAVYDLRYMALKQRYEIRKSPVCGFIGGRIDLIPHQFYIASEIASRHIPRALLADEFGLGKTIEACLIMHRLLITGRIKRVLILVPESLVHQWFVEMLRRFNLLFQIFNDEFYHSIIDKTPDLNPFFEDQLFLSDINYLTENADIRQQVLDASWDMLIVDEAHHLAEGSDKYKLVAQLSQRTSGLLLISAIPEQLGPESHFARLRLLDPARYVDLDSFLKEAEHYQQVARVVDKILEKKPITNKDGQLITKAFPSESDSYLQHIKSHVHEAEQQLIGNLLDRYGVGRVMFRNSRMTIAGFPKRMLHLIKLPSNQEILSRLADEFAFENGDMPFKPIYDYKKDPRIHWLATFLRKKKHDKILLICHSMDKVKAIISALEREISVKAAVFHEELTLIQRDRNAAWFSEDDGAQILICSEIGSEGRNFQFAHHLVLFDLPLDPELLEQRIGRLDRIGQKSTIHIHIPYLADSVHELLVRWYHEGMNAFECNIPGGFQILQKFQAKVKKLAMTYYEAPAKSASAVEQLVRQTNIFVTKMMDRLLKGRQRLLELNSFRPQKAIGLIQQIEQIDQSLKIDHFMLRVFNEVGIYAEDIDKRAYFLLASELELESFPGFRGTEMFVSFDRQLAMHREDIEFLSWDHPMVSGAIDMILGREKGNCACAVWQSQDSPTILLEAIFVLECIAPPDLHLDRFLPATPIRVLVNHDLADLSADYPYEFMKRHLKDDDGEKLLQNPQVTQSLFPKMLAYCQELASSQSVLIREEGRRQMTALLKNELQRLSALKAVNPAVKEEEIEMARQEIKSLDEAISSVQLRLDALRLIWKK